MLLPASQVLIDRIGWRDAYQWFGIAALCLLAPLLLMPWRLFATGSPHVVKKRDANFVDDGWTLKSAMRYHAFWALFSTFFFTAVAMYAITAQIVAYLIDAGFPPLQAATAWGFSGVVLLFGMLGISTLDGIIGRRELPPPAARQVYELTDDGRDLATAMAPLIAWGVRRIGDRKPGETFRARWPAVAMAGLADREAAKGVSETYQFLVGDSAFHFTVDDGAIDLSDGQAENPAVTWTTDEETWADIQRYFPEFDREIRR